MPTYITTLYIIIILCNLALALLVFYKNKKSYLNIFFSLFTLNLSAWIFTIYLLYTNNSYLLLIGRLNFVFAELIAFFIFWFSFYFPIKIFVINPTIKYSLSLLTVLLVIVTLFTDLIDKEEVYNNVDGLITVHGNYYIVFALYFVLLVIISTIIVVLKYKKMNKVHKLHIKYYIIGSLIYIYFGIFSNIILTTFTNSSNSSKIGPIFSIVFVISTSYAILKHKLLDIKSVTVTFLLFTLNILSFIDLINSTTSFTIILDAFKLFSTLIISVYIIKNLHKEIHSRKIMEIFAKDLERTNVKLHKLDDAKTEFMSITAHQLRTPLTATKGYVSLILEGAYGDVSDKIMSALRKVYRSNERLIELVEDLLNISRIESGHMEYKFQETSLNNIMNSLYETFVLRTNKKKIDFTINTGSTNIMIYADPLKIKEVISNLIDNSVKYTDKGFVSVDVKIKSGKVDIIITDSGIGISKKVLSKLFTKFSRGKKASGIHIEGTGLGLFVGKKIAEAHDGSIKVSSDGEGKGSKFTLTLPILKINL